MISRTALPLLGLASLLALTGACGQLLGLDKFTEGQGGSAGTTGTTSTTGTGGSGGHPTKTCTPGEVKACPYTGAGATENKGICHAGTQSCLPDGTGFEACTGEVLPKPEDCATPEDDDCDGTMNQAAAGCVCAPDASEVCYDGAPATAHVGACVDGSHVCAKDGKSWGPCTGEVLPKAADDCATAEDDDCSGMANEGCPCTPNSTAVCFSGPAATKGKGICTEGMWTCKGDGSGYGPCVGEVLPQASDDCTNSVDEDCSGTYCTEVTWSRGTGNGVISDIVVDAAGNAYITGHFSDSLGLINPPLINAGGRDGFAAKLDANGNTIWAIRFGDVQHQYGTGIALDSAGNVIIVGYFNTSVTFGAITLGGPSNNSYQIFVAKLDNNGNALWAKQFGDPAGSVANQSASAVAVDPSDNIVFAGQFATHVDLGTGSTILAKGNSDAFIAKLDKTGTNTLLAKTYGAAGTALGAGRIAVDSAGNATLIGTFTGSVNFGFGAPTAANATGADAFLLRISPAGGSVWVKSFGNGKAISFTDVAVDTSGRTILSGGFAGTVTIGQTMLTVPMAGMQSNAFVAQFDATGLAKWAFQYGNSAAAVAESYISGLGIDLSGNVLLSGRCNGAFDLGFPLDCSGASGSMFLIKTNSMGSPLWGRAYPNGGGGLVASTSSPFAVVSGASIMNQLDLGNGALPEGDVLARIAIQ